MAHRHKSDSYVSLLIGNSTTPPLSWHLNTSRRGAPLKTMSNPLTVKKIKEEEPDGIGESIFEAARRRHEVRSRQITGGAAAEASGPSRSGTKAESGSEIAPVTAGRRRQPGVGTYARRKLLLLPA